MPKKTSRSTRKITSGGLQTQAETPQVPPPGPESMPPALPTNRETVIQAYQVTKSLVARHLGVTGFLAYVVKPDGSVSCITPDGRKYSFTAEQIAEMQ